MTNITNDLITSYIDTLYQSKGEILDELRFFAEDHHVPIIQKDTEGLLISLLKIKKPVRILEIGTAIGYSSSCFAQACDCRITTIESDKDTYDIALSNIKAIGYDHRIDVKLGDARRVLKDMSPCEKKSFDLVFIDAAKSHYREFWDLCAPMCADGALMICDNVLMMGMTASDIYDVRNKHRTSIKKMREFLGYINNLEYADTCVLPVGDGVSVSVIDLSKLKKTDENE